MDFIGNIYNLFVTFNPIQNFQNKNSPFSTCGEYRDRFVNFWASNNVVQEERPIIENISFCYFIDGL